MSTPSQETNPRPDEQGARSADVSFSRTAGFCAGENCVTIEAAGDGYLPPGVERLQGFVAPLRCSIDTGKCG
jgi:hypothetical protein